MIFTLPGPLKAVDIWVLEQASQSAKPDISVGTICEEVLKLPWEICSETCINHLERQLVIDPAKRPNTEMALKHPFVRSIAI